MPPGDDLSGDRVSGRGDDVANFDGNLFPPDDGLFVGSIGVDGGPINLFDRGERNLLHRPFR